LLCPPDGFLEIITTAKGAILTEKPEILTSNGHVFDDLFLFRKTSNSH
ncbi:hypothetical protein CEXT_344911, partial [Caerostris extrusa]